MANFRGSTLTVGLVGLLATLSMAACSDDGSDKLSRGGPGGPGSSGSSGDPNGSSSGDPNSGGGVPYEEQVFRKYEAEITKKCDNGACHATGTYTPKPTPFLAPPDAYKSIKAAPGIVTPSLGDSAFLNKGPHAGPAVSADPEFEKHVIEWLTAEVIAIQSVKKPSTDPVAIKQGPNDLDLTKAAIGGLTGAHLTFDAALVGQSLSLSNLKLVAAAGTDVHILKPRFIRIAANKEWPDPANTFENIDQTVGGGSATVLGPGTALFSHVDWRPFDFAADKIRIEIEKLEPGKLQVIEPPKVCKNVANFTANVLPNLRGQQGGFLNCANCHGNGLAGLSLNNADQTLVCNQVLGKLNAPPNLATSLIITKVVNGPHSGGITPNAGNWAAVWTNNQAVFF